MEKECKVFEDKHTRELLLIKEEIDRIKKTHGLPNVMVFGYDELCITLIWTYQKDLKFQSLKYSMVLKNLPPIWEDMVTNW